MELNFQDKWNVEIELQWTLSVNSKRSNYRRHSWVTVGISYSLNNDLIQQNLIWVSIYCITIWIIYFSIYVHKSFVDIWVSQIISYNNMLIPLFFGWNPPFFGKPGPASHGPETMVRAEVFLHDPPTTPAMDELPTSQVPGFFVGALCGWKLVTLW